MATVLHSTIPGIRECCNDMVMQTANEQNTILFALYEYRRFVSETMGKHIKKLRIPKGSEFLFFRRKGPYLPSAILPRASA